MHSELMSESSAADRSVPGVDLKVLEFPTMSDPRGSLTICEFEQHLPFTPKRLFFIRGVPEGVDRGGHAHRECHQIWVCLEGSMRLSVDNGFERATYVLDDPGRGYLVPAGVWNDLQEFAPGTVLMAITSHPYNSDDYVHGYDEFVSWARSRS